MNGPWAIVLAGGDGVRLRSVTESLAGDSRPKQFCALLGDQTLVDQTLRRAALSVRPDRCVVVVTAPHAPYWASLAREVPEDRLVVQPDNRGTAPALLLALQAVEALADNAPVIVLPSDHHVSDDRTFMAHADRAVDVTAKCPDTPILLGIDAAYPEVEYGWIEPARLASPRQAPIHPVRRFWEKPDLATAKTLLERGCLWNSMVMVGLARAFVSLMQATVPDLVGIMDPLRRASEALRQERLERIYADLPVLGFSERVLTIRPEQCLVQRVSGVGWTDLGTPARLFEVMRRRGHERPGVVDDAGAAMVPAVLG